MNLETDINMGGKKKSKSNNLLQNGELDIRLWGFDSTSPLNSGTSGCVATEDKKWHWFSNAFLT